MMQTSIASYDPNHKTSKFKAIKKILHVGNEEPKNTTSRINCPKFREGHETTLIFLIPLKQKLYRKFMDQLTQITFYCKTRD